MFGSPDVPPGSYPLFAMPGPTSWKLDANKQTGQSAPSTVRTRT